MLLLTMKTSIRLSQASHQQVVLTYQIQPAVKAQLFAVFGLYSSVTLKINRSKQIKHCYVCDVSGNRNP